MTPISPAITINTYIPSGSNLKNSGTINAGSENQAAQNTLILALIKILRTIISTQHIVAAAIGTVTALLDILSENTFTSCAP